MWNFSNAVSGYKETRTWNFVPFAGVGWARSYGNDTHDNEIGFDVGLLNVVRLCSSLDLTLEARCLLVNQRFDGVTGGRLGEGMLSVTGRSGLQVQPPRLRARLERATGGHYALSRPDPEP